ncbi:site-specific integrase [Aliarcobacter cryaerophilus]|uniref:Site-specific integrase n=1 Tax=Aliarcobacter cryaerophilus TaxID=28198 RepID=A0A7G9LKQ0_9BACT|nr:site-specific integrase [Aliarcobacter cryaerophilus]QNM89199.1 site-specific integrase [Aliarcobacter cryaerophilus]
MRPGEIVALKWSDVDFERKMISIERTRIRSKKGEKPKDGLTKTMSSNRKIDLLPIAEQALLEQMKLTVDATYIFLNQSNEPFYVHDIIGKRFREIIKQSGVKERPLYNLRHTFASQMISRGADIVWVSNMLGHKNVSITLSTYTKFIKEDDEVRIRNIEKMGTIMGTFSD